MYDQYYESLKTTHFSSRPKEFRGGKKNDYNLRQFFHVCNRVSDMDLRLKKQLNHLKAKVERI
jgi:hypothetical protein